MLIGPVSGLVNCWVRIDSRQRSMTCTSLYVAKTTETSGRSMGGGWLDILSGISLSFGKV